MRWASLAIFFLALGLGEVCTGYAWNLPSEGTGVVGFWLVSPAEGTGALALVRFKLVCMRARDWTDTRVQHTGPHHHLLHHNHNHNHNYDHTTNLANSAPATFSRM